MRDIDREDVIFEIKDLIEGSIWTIEDALTIGMDDATLEDLKTQAVKVLKNLISDVQKIEMPKGE